MRPPAVHMRKRTPSAFCCAPSSTALSLALDAGYCGRWQKEGVLWGCTRSQRGVGLAELLRALARDAATLQLVTPPACQVDNGFVDVEQHPRVGHQCHAQPRAQQHHPMQSAARIHAAHTGHRRQLQRAPALRLLPRPRLRQLRAEALELFGRVVQHGGLALPTAPPAAALLGQLLQSLQGRALAPPSQHIPMAVPMPSDARGTEEPRPPRMRPRTESGQRTARERKRKETTETASPTTQPPHRHRIPEGEWRRRPSRPTETTRRTRRRTAGWRGGKPTVHAARPGRRRRRASQRFRQGGEKEGMRTKEGMDSRRGRSEDPCQSRIVAETRSPSLSHHSGCSRTGREKGEGEGVR